MRSPTAKAYTAGHRIYGNVNSTLMWVMDMAAMDQPMQSHVSAELKRVDDAPGGTFDPVERVTGSGRDEDVAVVVHRVGAQCLPEVGHPLDVDDVDRRAAR